MAESLAFLQPAWLGVALMGLAWSTVSFGRRPPRVAPSAPDAPLRDEPGPPRRRAHLVRQLMLPVGATALAAWLLVEATPTALGLLAAAALLAAGWTTLSALRARRPPIATPPLLLTVALRTAAWGVVLVLLSQPSCRIVATHWERPLLVALLDDSRSMDLVDEQGGTTRAAAVNRILGDAVATLAELHERYDVRRLRFGAGVAPAEAWRIDAGEPLSAVAGALGEAARLAALAGDAGAAVLLIGDGAENVLDAEAVREAAHALAAKRVPLLTAGAGPPPERTPAVELGRLALPARVAVREPLRVPVSARVRGCRAAALTLELLWDDAHAARTRLHVPGDDAKLSHEFETSPTAPGVQRVTARLTLPPDLGGATFETSTFVDVDDSRVRVLWLDGPPRPEATFALRALRDDPRLNVAYRPLFGGVAADEQALPDDWRAQDVVVLGAAPRAALRRTALEALATAVLRDGVGLLLAGGEPLLVDAADQLRPLADIAPVELPARAGHAAAGHAGRWFLPTDAGLRHPVLTGEHPDDAPGAWADLPPLEAAAGLRTTGALALTLATDQRLQPLLVVQAAGAGRVAAAGWGRSWPWALASEPAAALHQRLWRRLIGWLANRRPRPWVLTDQPRYTLSSLNTGQQRVRIRAGLAGTHGFEPAPQPHELQALLTLRMVPAAASRPATASAAAASVAVGLRGAQPIPVLLERSGDEWIADAPRAAVPIAFAGVYELELTLTASAPATSATADGPAPAAAPEPLIARTRFAVLDADLEQQHPTANLALLREAAETTSASGGRYVPLDTLPALLRELATIDRRRRVERESRYDVVDRHAGLLLGVLVAALAGEWLIRKRLRLV